MIWHWLAALSLVFSSSVAPQDDAKKSTKPAAASKDDAKKTANSAAPDDDAKKSAKSNDDSPFKSLAEKASYAIGLNIGKSLKGDSVDVDVAALTKELKDGLAGAKPLLTDKEIQETMIALQKEIEMKKGKVNDDFLAENMKKEGVKTTASGLQYKIIKPGTGKTPKASDTVVTHYRGTLVDGTEFDSSYKRGEPASFRVNGVIAGWTEALQLMPVGSKWQLVIPGKLAYGQRGSPPDIGPNATLIFEIELIGIK